MAAPPSATHLPKQNINGNMPIGMLDVDLASQQLFDSQGNRIMGKLSAPIYMTPAFRYMLGNVNGPQGTTTVGDLATWGDKSGRFIVDTTWVQATSKLALFTTTKQGLVPAPGSVSGRFLGDDGTWHTLAGGGNVNGPASSTVGHLALWNNTSGTLLQDAAFSGDGTLSGSGVFALTNIKNDVTMAGDLLATNIAAPATPAAGSTRIYVDSTQKVLSAINDAGTISNTVVPASAAAHNWVTGISAAGVLAFAQPNFTDLAGTIAAGQIPNSTITLAMQANIGANTILGNNTGSPAAPIALTQAQATALLNQFTSTLQGLVSSSGGGTTNFLRADNTWAAPPGTNITIGTTTITSGTTRRLLYDNAAVVGESTITVNSSGTGGLVFPAGTTSVAPIVLTSGTNLTTAAAGAEEFDGTCFYMTSVASSRQVVDTEQVLVQNGTRTFAANTNAQAIFNASANGAVTLAGSTTFEFEMYVAISGYSSSAHTLNLTFATSGSFTSFTYFYDAQTGSTLAGPTATLSGFVAVATATAICASTTTTGLVLRVRGTIRMNATGTVTPQLTQVTNSAAAVLQAGSFFRCWPIGTNSVTTVGDWS